MRTSRSLAVGVACTGIVTVGWVAGHQDSASSGVPGSGQAGSTPGADASASLADGTYTGAVVNNLRGSFEASVTIAGGTITDVTILQAGTQEAESQRVNAFAKPQLVERILQAQTWDVQAVSGASYTSDGLRASVKDALAQAAQS